MTTAPAPAHPDTAVLAAVERRVLWLATAIVHHANRVRPNPSGLKVGGHQASSASIATIMTELWFRHLRPQDRVSVKPHASPVLHAINYLLGDLPAEYLGTLREFGGLQSYPSRAKDPDPVDYSTGSVGIGATAPIWGALARRYTGRFGDVGTGRQYSLLGDAELDEGACWEAILDPMVGELGEVVWVVDLNRQSLDRVVPILGATRLQGMFAAAGWQVLTVKYGHLLQELFARPGGEALRARIDEMSNPEYQRLLRCTDAQLRERLPGGDTGADPGLRALIDSLDDATLRAGIRNLGGHDLDALGEAFTAIDDTRPTVIFAYTVKGHGLADRGTPPEPLLAADDGAVRGARRAARDRHRRPVGAVRGRLARGRGVCGDRRAPAPRPGPGRRAARGTGRPGPHPVRHRHHPGRPRSRAARPHPVRARHRGPGGHARAGRQLVDQPRWLGQQGRGVGRP